MNYQQKRNQLKNIGSAVLADKPRKGWYDTDTEYVKAYKTANGAILLDSRKYDVSYTYYVASIEGRLGIDAIDLVQIDECVDMKPSKIKEQALAWVEKHRS